jgi:hypothetical protein
MPATSIKGGASIVTALVSALFRCPASFQRRLPRAAHGVHVQHAAACDMIVRILKLHHLVPMILVRTTPIQ